MSCLWNCDLLSWDGLIYVKLFSKPWTLTCTSLRQLLRATGCHNAPWHYFSSFSTVSVFYLHYLALAQVILSKQHNNITALHCGLPMDTWTCLKEARGRNSFSRTAAGLAANRAAFPCVFDSESGWLIEVITLVESLLTWLIQEWM